MPLVILCRSPCPESLRLLFFFTSRRRHTRLQGDWSSDVCSSDLELAQEPRWSERLGGFVRRSPVREIDFYAERLHALGLPAPVVIEKVYGHEVAGARDRKSVV